MDEMTGRNRPAKRRRARARSVLARSVLVRCAMALGVTAVAAGPAAAAITQAQHGLPTEKLTIINQKGKPIHFTVEVATTEKQQEIGLMFRKNLAADHGMLFPWQAPQVSEMWMKNTLIPLDMVFIRADGTIDSIAQDTVPHSLRIIRSHGKVAATLELQGGITAKDDIDVGNKVIAKQFSSGQ